MRITKYVHSCLLVENAQRVALFDPGHYSWESGLFKVGALKRLDDIIISHEHGDHMHIPFLRALVEKFPDARLTVTPPAARKLIAAGFKNVRSESSAGIELFANPHEPVAPIGTVAENNGAHYLGRFTHPGDSYALAECKDILALPITAPAWGTLAKAAELGQRLRPKYVIPIHDWQLREEARQKAYRRLTEFFAPLGTEFISPTNGVPFEL
ncbi:MAG: hypothetical protein JWN01_325 [Patescibacteria group bacterium]|nr:hypothetical protein [Patescibacteria group bacterium]